MTPLTSGTTARRLYGLVEPIGLIPYAAAGACRGAAGARSAQLLGHLFRRAGSPAGPRCPGRRRARDLLQLRPGRGRPPHPACLGPDHARGGAGGARPRVRRGATADARRPRRQPQRRAGCRPRRQGGHLHPDRGASPLRSAADDAGPEQPLARLWYAGNLLREHRGDGHVVALVANGIGGTEAHVLLALSEGMPAEKFGRVSHLPRAQLAAVVDGMRDRGLIGADGWLTADGRATKARIEALTDDLAAPAYDALEPSELAQLIADLEPIAAALNAAYDSEN